MTAMPTSTENTASLLVRLLGNLRSLDPNHPAIEQVVRGELVTRNVPIGHAVAPERIAVVLRLVREKLAAKQARWAARRGRKGEQP